MAAAAATETFLPTTIKGTYTVVEEGKEITYMQLEIKESDDKTITQKVKVGEKLLPKKKYIIKGGLVNSDTKDEIRRILGYEANVSTGSNCNGNLIIEVETSVPLEEINKKILAHFKLEPKDS